MLVEITSSIMRGIRTSNVHLANEPGSRSELVAGHTCRSIGEALNQSRTNYPAGARGVNPTLLSLGCRPFPSPELFEPGPAQKLLPMVDLDLSRKNRDPVPFHVVPMRGSGGNPLPRSVAAKPDTLSLRVLSYGRSDHAHPGNRRSTKASPNPLCEYLILAGQAEPGRIDGGHVEDRQVRDHPR